MKIHLVRPGSEDTITMCGLSTADYSSTAILEAATCAACIHSAGI